MDTLSDYEHKREGKHSTQNWSHRGRVLLVGHSCLDKFTLEQRQEANYYSIAFVSTLSHAHFTNLYQYIDDCHWYTCTSTSALHPPLTIFSLVRPFYYLLNGLRRSANVFAFDFWFWTFECCIFSLLIALQTWWLIFSDDLYVGQPSLTALAATLADREKSVVAFLFPHLVLLCRPKTNTGPVGSYFNCPFSGRKERKSYLLAMDQLRLAIVKGGCHCCRQVLFNTVLLATALIVVLGLFFTYLAALFTFIHWCCSVSKMSVCF